MNRRARILKAVAASMALASLAGACSSQARAGNPGLCRQDDPENRQTIPVPPVLGGLSVKIDEKSTKQISKENQANASYMCDGAVFALRGGKNGKELRAILTIQRLTSDADTTDPDFRTRIVDPIAGGQRKPERIGDTLVYKVKSNQQLVAIWFKERFLGMLMVREDRTAGFSGEVDFDRLLVEAISLDPVRV